MGGVRTQPQPQRWTEVAGVNTRCEEIPWGISDNDNDNDGDSDSDDSADSDRRHRDGLVRGRGGDQRHRDRR